MKIFFSVGEPSGDLHGANLIRELRQRRVICSWSASAGPGWLPRMQAGGRPHAVRGDVVPAGIVEPASFLRLLHRADVCFREERPDGVVLIDYPGFNWWVARRAKRYGSLSSTTARPSSGPGPLADQKMRRYVDDVLCLLPFEADCIAGADVVRRMWTSVF